MPRASTSSDEKISVKSKIVKNPKSLVKDTESNNSCTTPIVKKVKIKKVKSSSKDEASVKKVYTNSNRHEESKSVPTKLEEVVNENVRDDENSGIDNVSNTDSEQRDLQDEEEFNDTELENNEDETVDDSLSNTSSKRKKARKLQKEDFIPKWEYLFEQYAPELKNARKQPHQNVSLMKYLTTLKNETYKFMKLRKRKQETGKTSGFMKEVKISDELEEFIGKGLPNEPITRVFITQKLCNYIKQMDLQNPNDKRTIIPDEKLKRLFDIKDTEKEKLTYYSMQQKIQRHIYKL